MKLLGICGLWSTAHHGKYAKHFAARWFLLRANA